MKTRLKQTPQVLAAVCLLALAGAAALAHADCARVIPGSAEARAAVLAEPRAEAAVSMTDPALDGLFARYADLHRDAAGYAVADVVSSSMFAKAVPDSPNRLTR